MNIDHYKKMAELHHRMNAEDTVVGWYMTGDSVRQSAVLFQKFFWREMNQSPVHLLVGTDVTHDSISVNTFYSLAIHLTNEAKPVQNQFIPLPFDYVTSEHERAAFDILSKSKTGKLEPLSDLGSLESALLRLRDTLILLQSHVSDVLAGKAPQNAELGRFLQHTLSQLPSNDISFETMFSNGTLDTLMLIYLANLTRSHLFLAERAREPSA